MEIRSLVKITVSVAALVLAASATTSQEQSPKDGKEGITFYDVEKQTAEFIGYERSIKLTQEQQAIKAEALDSIQAPCCQDYSILTCCCECNLAKSVWGLSKYLIVQRQFDATRVKRAVEDWLQFTNPSGYSGEACYRERCNKPFKDDGCGGMSSK